MAVQQLQKYFQDKSRVKGEFSNEELARQRAFTIRYKSLENLDKQLLEFESHFSKHQGKLIWAPKSDWAFKEIKELAGPKVYTRQHRLLHEIGLLDSKPSGWTYFDESYFRYNPDNPSFPEWQDAQAGQKQIAARPQPDKDSCAILFPEFYISENGSLLLANNDPYVNALLNTCKRIIFIVGIEQVCPTMADSEYFLSLLGKYRFGKSEFNDYTFVSPGNSQRELHPQTEMHVVMLDNGRTDILGHIPERQSLYCIQCGACKQESNHLVLNSSKPAIIDAIKQALVEGSQEKHWQALFDFPLSGRASQDCPVNVDLKGLLLHMRQLAVTGKHAPRGESYAWIAWKKAMMSRKWLNKGAQIKNFTLKSFFKKSWGEQREFPKITDKSFNDWWLETRGKEEA